jgi:hypothetical protein
MRRRDFITLLGGALADQAIPAKAQEPVRVRTVGVLIGFANDAAAKARVKAFEQGLEREGWSLGQNLRIEYRYAEGDGTVGPDFQVAGFGPFHAAGASDMLRLNPGSAARGGR